MSEKNKFALAAAYFDIFFIIMSMAAGKKYWGASHREAHYPKMALKR